MGEPLKAEEFLESLEKGRIGAAVVLLGSDVYWRNLCREKLLAVFVPSDVRLWAVTRFSLKENPLDSALLRARTVPMLGLRQLVFIEDVERLEGRSEKSDSGALDQLASYLNDPPSFTVLIFEAETLDQRTRLYRLLSQKATVVALITGDEVELETISRMAGSMGVGIDRDAATLLVDLSGGELARAQMELEKLAAYVGELKRITAVDVRQLVFSAQVSSVWELAEVLAVGPRRHALEMLDRLLRAGESGPKLIGAFAWMYRKLVEAQELSTQVNHWQAARQLGMRPETAEIVLRQARKIDREQLRKGLVVLAEADNQLKSGGVDQRTVLEFLIVQLTAGVAAANGPNS
jgi:DNA polymerase III subunit delta